MSETITITRDEFAAYQRAVERAKHERAIMLLALKAIDRHIVGACPIDEDFPEPCDECGEMREIAAQALKAIQEGA